MIYVEKRYVVSSGKFPYENNIGRFKHGFKSMNDVNEFLENVRNKNIWNVYEVIIASDSGDMISYREVYSV